jgi:hypothetical protein
MIFLYFMIAYFIVLFILGWTLSFMTYRLMKRNNFKIEKKSYKFGYTIKELSQLYGQSNSRQTSNKIAILIKLTNSSIGKIFSTS